MDYVSLGSQELALKMEKKLAALPGEAGILFVSVRPEPTESGEAVVFRILAGVSRSTATGAAHALVARTLTEEISVGVNLMVSVHRGILGACKDDSPGTARPSAS